MKVLLITIMLLILAILPAMSQGSPNNIAVGETQIMAVYPDMAEFLINVPASQVTIVRFDDDGNHCQSTYEAALTQTAPEVYRAEFCGSSWFEINTITGATTMCHLGDLEAFFPGDYAGR